VLDAISPIERDQSCSNSDGLSPGVIRSVEDEGNCCVIIRCVFSREFRRNWNRIFDGKWYPLKGANWLLGFCVIFAIFRPFL